MKDSINIIIVFIFIIVFRSCNQGVHQDTLIINPENAIEREIWLSEFTDDIKYILLDKKVMFQHPNRIETTKELFVIKIYPGGILTFDREGNFIENIGREGRGPGEYLSGGYYSINQEDELVYILDVLANKVITYNLLGELVREFSIAEYEDTFWDIQYSNGKLYLAGVINFGYSKYDWIIIDTLGNLYSYKYNHVPRFESRSSSFGGMFVSDENLYYWNNFNDTIFHIQDSLYKPAMYFAQGDFRYPHRNITSEDYRKYYSTLSIIKTNGFLILSYLYQQYFQSGVIRKNDGRLNIIDKTDSPFTFDLPGIPNDLDGGPAFPPYYYFQENGEEFLIGWIHAFRLKSHVESKAFKNSTPKYPEKKKKLEELAASLDENDNPVLMLVALKE